MTRHGRQYCGQPETGVCRLAPDLDFQLTPVSLAKKNDNCINGNTKLGWKLKTAAVFQLTLVLSVTRWEHSIIQQCNKYLLNHSGVCTLFFTPSLRTRYRRVSRKCWRRWTRSSRTWKVWNPIWASWKTCWKPSWELTIYNSTQRRVSSCLDKPLSWTCSFHWVHTHKTFKIKPMELRSSSNLGIYFHRT